MSTFNVKRTEFCYGGVWTAHLNLGSGILKQCYCGAVIQNIFKDVKSPIKWAAIGNNCGEPHCHNSHVWLTLGAIPEMATPTYASMRNRVCIDGSEWLTDRMKNFLSGKLADNNVLYSQEEMDTANKKSRRRLAKTMPYANRCDGFTCIFPTRPRYGPLKTLQINIKWKCSISQLFAARVSGRTASVLLL